MTGPTPRFAHCKCSHSKLDHEGPLAPQCDATHCTCLQYRPNSAPDRAPAATVTSMREPSGVSVAGERTPTLEQLLAAGKRSDFQRTVKLAEKIAVLLNDLRGRLADERENAEQKRRQDAQRELARKQIAELEKQLAAAKAALRGKAVNPGEVFTVGEYPCDGCAESFTTPQARGAHKRYKHPAVAS